MKSFNRENYPWSIDGLQECIKENKIKAKIIAINGNKAIVRVNSYGASQVLGEYSDWCISQHKCSWEQYVSNHPNNIQVFFFNFGLQPTDNLSLVGATFTMNEDWKSMKLMCCFTRENHPIGEKIKRGPESDLEALNKLITIPNFHFEITSNNNPLFNSFAGERETVVEIKKEEKKDDLESPWEHDFRVVEMPHMWRTTSSHSWDNEWDDFE